MGRLVQVICDGSEFKINPMKDLKLRVENSWQVQFMKHAETVTFGGSGLDRAAEMRGDSDALAARDTASGLCILAW